MVAAGEVLHAVDADGYKAGCKDWGMPGRDVERKGEERRRKKSLIFHVRGRGSPLQGPGAQCSLTAYSVPVCLKGNAAETKRSLFILWYLLQGRLQKNLCKQGSFIFLLLRGPV